MLIIFDLDDTLIDTSGCLTPIKLEDALRKMMQAGLSLSDEQSALEELRQLNDTSSSAKEALAEFLEIHNGRKELLHVGITEIYDNCSEELPIFSFEGVIEGLKILQQQHTLSLVTKGNEQHQRAKLKNAGIDCRIFSKIVVCGVEEKGLHYLQLSKELEFACSDVIVCGDRIANDLAPARKLGMKTIQMLKGRGKSQRDQSSDVDYRINEFKEILEVVLVLCE